MAQYRVAWMPGDGVGQEVMSAARVVLDAMSFDVEWVQADIGWSCWCAEGDAFPQRTIDALIDTDCALFGAVTSKPRAESQDELAPELRGSGLVYSNPVAKLHRMFHLHTSVRPCKAYPGNPLNSRDDIDLVVFRENTDGVSGGIDLLPVSESVFDALCDEPSLTGLSDLEGMDPESIAVSTRVTSRQGCARILTRAFEYARTHGRRSVTLVEQPNVLRDSGSLMTRVAREVARKYPDIPLLEASIDSICMWMTRHPQDYDVLVVENLFGDIISDLCAGLVGGPGFACGAFLGDDYALFEPAHGSAPTYGGRPIVNPMAMLAAVTMMFDWLGEADAAQRLDGAMARVIREHRCGTSDVGLSNSAREVAEEVARLL